MIYNKKEFEKKLIDKDLNRKKLSALLEMSANTLRLKLDDERTDFKISEAQLISKLLDLSTEEFFLIFFDKKLSFNESCGGKNNLTA